jgi:4-amino-4-deoxy-L-arabinose transferase-like glycosyltransferase
MQAFLLPFVALLGVALTVLVVMQGYVLPLLGTLGVGTGVLMVREAKHAKTREATTYPFPAVTLAGTFAGQLSWSMIRYSRAFRYAAAIAGIIAAGTGFRLWGLASQPDWQVDEVTYTTIAKNLLYHHRLSLPPAWLQPWKPFLFHPPFYFYLLSSWFHLVGASIYHARILGVICAGITFSLLARFIWKDYGPKAATFTLLFVVIDGWMQYIQRVSYMENVLMILVVGTVLVYQKARETESWWWFIATGLVAGCAIIFKHTGAYVVVTLAIAWLLTRKQFRKHVAMLGVAGFVCVVYVWYMVHTDGMQAPFTKPFVWAWGKNNYYVHQTLLQLNRTTGFQKSGGGSVTSVGQFFHLLISPTYAEFIPSFLITIVALFLLGRTYVRCFRVRSFAPVGEHVILTAWATAGSVSFAAIALKFSQYFILFLLPLYCYFWTYVVEAIQRRSVSIGKPVLAFGVIGVILAGFASFQVRVHSSPGNVLQEAIVYVRHNIPQGDLVIASTPIAYGLSQRWCTQRDPHMPEACLKHADYIVTWQTYLQPINPENESGFSRLVRQSRQIKVIPGFNGKVTIWKVESHSGL